MRTPAIAGGLRGLSKPRAARLAVGTAWSLVSELGRVDLASVAARAEGGCAVTALLASLVPFLGAATSPAPHTRDGCRSASRRCAIGPSSTALLTPPALAQAPVNARFLHCSYTARPSRRARALAQLGSILVVGPQRSGGAPAAEAVILLAPTAAGTP